MCRPAGRDLGMKQGRAVGPCLRGRGRRFASLLRGAPVPSVRLLLWGRRMRRPDGWGLLLDGILLKQGRAARLAAQLAFAEQADLAVHAVIPRLADHFLPAQAADRLGDRLVRIALHVLQRDVVDDLQFRAEPVEQTLVVSGDPLALGADAQNLGQHLRQRYEAADRARGIGRRVATSPRACDALSLSKSRKVAVGQVVHAVHDADGQRFAAGRAASAQALGLLRQQAQVAASVAVEMVFALFGEEFDRAQIAPAGFQRRADGEVVEFGVEHAGFAPQLFGRVRVGVGHQPEAVQRRHPPVHLRVGRQAGFDREDVRGEVGVALVDGVEPGLRAERGEPRRPDVGRHEIRAGVRLQGDLQQMPRVQAENGPPVGSDVADGRQLLSDAPGCLQVRRVEQVMNFARLVALFVDRRDFDR